MSVDRRKFLVNGWKFGSVLLFLAAGRTSWELLRPLRVNGAGGKIKLKSPANYKPGTAEYVTAGRLWVANPGDGKILALSQKCPHLGCRVPFCDSSGRFECPCHGSIFNIAGEYIQGPSPRGMDRFTITKDDKSAYFVDTSKSTPGPGHGSHEYPSDAKGPACAGG